MIFLNRQSGADWWTEADVTWKCGLLSTFGSSPHARFPVRPHSSELRHQGSTGSVRETPVRSQRSEGRYYCAGARDREADVIANRSSSQKKHRWVTIPRWWIVAATARWSKNCVTMIVGKPNRTSTSKRRELDSSYKGRYPLTSHNTASSMTSPGVPSLASDAELQMVLDSLEKTRERDYHYSTPIDPYYFR